MRRQMLSIMYNNRRDLTEKSGTTVFLYMLHVLPLPVVKPMNSIAFCTGIQVYRFFCFGGSKLLLCYINLGYLLVCLGN